MRNIQNPETVQQHTISLIQLVNTIPGLEKYRDTELCAMLEVHDWPEAVVGDEVIIEHDKKVRAARKYEKHQRERHAMEQICTPLGSVGSEIFTLWERYDKGDDQIAKIAKQIDKYQALEQALYYEKECNIDGLFKEFRDYLLPEFTDQVFFEALKVLEQRAYKFNILF